MNKYLVAFTGLAFGERKQFEDTVTAPTEREAINFVKDVNTQLLGLKIISVESAVPSLLKTRTS